MKKAKRTLKAGLCVALAAMMCASVPMTAFATAGEDPGTVDDADKSFPDPDSFSYDDVEVNFAKALQYSLHFYAANGEVVNCNFINCTDESGGALSWNVHADLFGNNQQ